MRSGSGPKPKPIEEHRRNRMMINFTDAELQALIDLARDEKPATFARQIVLGYLKRRGK